MFHPFSSSKPDEEQQKQKKIDQKIKKLSIDNIDVLSSSLEENCRIFWQLFRDNDTIISRKVQNMNYPAITYQLFFSDGMVDTKTLNESIIDPLIHSQERLGHNPIETLTKKVLIASGVRNCYKWEEMVDAITYGEVLVLLPHCDKALILDVKQFTSRGITEPETERILSGPREGFNECLNTNLTMLRRRLRTHDLKLKYRTFGTKTQTKACICYLESVVDKAALKILNQRLEQIIIDGVLDTNYLTELIRDAPYSPFRATGYTERPDVVAGKLLEGRIAVFLDGTPVVMTVPYLFIENFQSNEDYYLSFYYTSFSRMLRILGFLLTITVPAFYIAIVAFHQEMLPTPLLVNIANERQGVPLPASLEAFIMLLVFDILRETGIRMPTNIGQALSIVGALVIGQAAVEAKLVAAPMIIIVGITGITGLLVPKMNAPIIFVRLFILIGASMMGLFGMMLTFSIAVIHALNLESFGVSQITPKGEYHFQENKDKPIRAPWWDMITRPQTLSKDTVRLRLYRKNKP